MTLLHCRGLQKSQLQQQSLWSAISLLTLLLQEVAYTAEPPSINIQMHLLKPSHLSMGPSQLAKQAAKPGL